MYVLNVHTVKELIYVELLAGLDLLIFISVIFISVIYLPKDVLMYMILYMMYNNIVKFLQKRKKDGYCESNLVGG